MKFTVSIIIDDSTAMRTCGDVAEQLEVIACTEENRSGRIRDLDDDVVGEWSVG